MIYEIRILIPDILIVFQLYVNRRDKAMPCPYNISPFPKTDYRLPFPRLLPFKNILIPLLVIPACYGHRHVYLPHPSAYAFPLSGFPCGA